MVNPVLYRLGHRAVTRNPLQALLLLMGIALGVAIVVAVDLSNSSARKAFELSMDMTVGNATHSLAGGREGIPEQLYTRIRTELGIRDSAPSVNAEIRINEHRVTLLGLDLFAHSFDRPLQESIISTRAITALLTRPGTATLTRETAEELNITPGGLLTASFRGNRLTLEVVAIVDDASPGGKGIMVVDIATAQELLDRRGRLDRIDLTLTTEQARELGEILPGNVELLQTDAQRRSAQQLTAAFYTNLSAMSLLALLVGAFLVYNSVTFSVLRRRKQFGIMRALGVSRFELFMQIIQETLIMAVFATAIGLMLGVGLAQFLVKLITTTINDLYFRLHVSQLLITPVPLLKGVLLGLLASVLAACFPAIEAARTTPISLQQRSGLEVKSKRYAARLSGIGAALAALGVCLMFMTPTSITYGFVSMALIIIGFSLVLPLLLARSAKLLVGLTANRAGFVTRICTRGITDSLSRTAVAITALTLAIATSIGVGLMIGSFRVTVIDWLDDSLPGDIYLSVPGSSASADERILPPALIARIAEHPAVASSWQSRFTYLRSEFGEVPVLATQTEGIEDRGIELVTGDRAAVIQALQEGKGVLISEPFANRYRLSAGDSFTMLTSQGARAVTVLGVFYNYSTERGLILLPLASYRSWWRDTSISSLGLIKHADYSAQAFRDLIAAETGQFPVEINIRSNDEIKSLSLEVFDRTFTITEVLRILSIVVAFTGIVSALLAVQMERRREFALLRASGCTPGEMVRLILGQAGLMGIFAALFAIPMGLLMSALLIEVINIRSFGWSMQQTFQLNTVLVGILVSIGAALLAGAWPAYKAAQTPIAGTLRQE